MGSHTAINPATVATPSTGPCGQDWAVTDEADRLQMSEPFPACLFSASCMVDALWRLSREKQSPSHMVPICLLPPQARLSLMVQPFSLQAPTASEAVCRCSGILGPFSAPAKRMIRSD